MRGLVTCKKKVHTEKQRAAPRRQGRDCRARPQTRDGGVTGAADTGRSLPGASLGSAAPTPGRGLWPPDCGNDVCCSGHQVAVAGRSGLWTQTRGDVSTAQEGSTWRTRCFRVTLGTSVKLVTALLMGCTGLKPRQCDDLGVTHGPDAARSGHSS